MGTPVCVCLGGGFPSSPAAAGPPISSSLLLLQQWPEPQSQLIEVAFFFTEWDNRFIWG